MTGSSAPDPLDKDLAGTLLAGRYRLGRKIGEGGMGAVYEATDRDERTVAVKVLGAAGHGDEQHIRFFRECATMAKLKHPNVVALLDTGTDLELGVPYLAMELMRGVDVGALVERLGPLEPGVAVRIALGAADGIAAAHAAGVIHRDVKPANVFLDDGDGDRVIVKVCDFGIAKQDVQSSNVTVTGRALGSPLYMAPEQAKNAKHVDVRADVWSLGVTLYEMLTGRTPVSADEPLGKILVSICTEDAPHVQTLAPWVDPRLAVVLHGALHRDPDARWSTLAAFASALRALLPEIGGAELARGRIAGVSDATRRSVAPRAVLTEAASLSSRPPPPDADPFVGKSLGGKYRLERQLGKGGMGAVYEAVAASGERFAAKVILNESTIKSAEAKKRFVREARAAAAIQSRNVVRLIEADDDLETGSPFLVLELLHGEDLAALVARVGALEPRAVARLAIQACAGLSAAHERGIVHRDIKPANLFLSRDDGGQVVIKVCDFGIAKNAANEAMDASGASLTQTGGVLGSPAYMSPEQAKNAKHVGVQSDVWSLCLTLWEALTGERPWAHATTLGELIVAICTEDVPRVVDRAPWVPEAFGAAVDRGLRREVERRWPDIASLARALEPFTDRSDALDVAALASAPSVQLAARSARVTPHGSSSVDRRSPELFESTIAASSASDGSSAQRRGRGRGIWYAAVAVPVVAALALTTRALWFDGGGSPPRAPAASSAAPAATVAAERPSASVVEPPPVVAPAASATESAAAQRPPANESSHGIKAKPVDAHAPASSSAEPRRPPPAAPDAPPSPRLQSSW